jgi:hypothetical protein
MHPTIPPFTHSCRIEGVARPYTYALAHIANADRADKADFRLAAELEDGELVIDTLAPRTPDMK